MKKPPMSMGDSTPRFRIPSSVNQSFSFDTIAGRYVALCFIQSIALPDSRKIINDFLNRIDVFDDDHVVAFVISTDPEDEAKSRHLPYQKLRFFWDFNQQMSETFAVADAADDPRNYSRQTILLDERLRFLQSIPIESADHVDRVIDELSRAPRLFEGSGFAPVLTIPRVLEMDVCRELVGYYKNQGGKESGYMQEKAGMTIPVINNDFKSRRDCVIEDEGLKKNIRERLEKRVIPEVYKAFQYRATRLERYIVACYDAEENGRFGAHRDNSTKATAHRKFAVTINLNADEYDGGDLRFPEFGSRSYRAPTGGAVVFSCTLLHEALPVTRGTRYACLPFLYDQESEKIRIANEKFLETQVHRGPLNSRTP